MCRDCTLRAVMGQRTGGLRHGRSSAARWIITEHAHCGGRCYWGDCARAADVVGCRRLEHAELAQCDAGFRGDGRPGHRLHALRYRHHEADPVPDREPADAVVLRNPARRHSLQDRSQDRHGWAEEGQVLRLHDHKRERWPVAGTCNERRCQGWVADGAVHVRQQPAQRSDFPERWGRLRRLAARDARQPGQPLQLEQRHLLPQERAEHDDHGQRLQRPCEQRGLRRG